MRVLVGSRSEADLSYGVPVPGKTHERSIAYESSKVQSR
jgi:hypothetical protein